MTDEERVWDGGDGCNEGWKETDWANGAHSEMRSPGVIVFFLLLLLHKLKHLIAYLYAKNKIVLLSPTAGPQNPQWNPEEFWEMWTGGGMEQEPATQTKTSASLDCKNSSTFSFDGWNMKDSNWDGKLCLKGPLQIELPDGQRPSCRLLSHDRCTS